MSSSFFLAKDPPPTDPTSLFEAFRGHFTTEILIGALVHFRLFDRLSTGPQSLASLAAVLQLAERPTQVMVTTLAAMGTLHREGNEKIYLTDLARNHLLADSPFYVGDYYSRAADSPGVKEWIRRLTTNRPKGADDSGVGFLYREGLKSAMEEAESARHFSLILAGRAKNVAPVLAKKLPLPGVRTLIDVGGGTGIYSVAFLRANPTLRAIVWDRPEVLKVAEDFARENHVLDRLELRSGDMFSDPVPEGSDLILLSNILHDWDLPQCQQLLARCASAIDRKGRLVIHDVLLNDSLTGPLHPSLYSAHLFSVTEGRLYSAAEYRSWLSAVGLTVSEIFPTLIHCSAIVSQPSPL